MARTLTMDEIHVLWQIRQALGDSGQAMLADLPGMVAQVVAERDRYLAVNRILERSWHDEIKELKRIIRLLAALLEPVEWLGQVKEAIDYCAKASAEVWEADLSGRALREAQNRCAALVGLFDEENRARTGVLLAVDQWLENRA